VLIEIAAGVTAEWIEEHTLAPYRVGTEVAA
jgi:hypothetical protein